MLQLEFTGEVRRADVVVAAVHLHFQLRIRFHCEREIG